MTVMGGLSTSLFCMVLSIVATIAAGYPLLRSLTKAGIRQSVSSDAPGRHASKEGTPTMGGLTMAVGLVAGGAALALMGRWNRDVAAAGIVSLAFGCIGFLDDYLIVRRGRNLGLTARQKLALQFCVAAVFTAWLRSVRGTESGTTVAGLDLGVWYYLIAVLLVVGLSNATNLADGLDGLSAGMSAIVFIGLGMLGGTPSPAAWILAGACAGMLWFNLHPALVFMGNTGALALGAAMATIGLLGRHELPLQLAAIVFWAETLSVMAQVLVFKWRKRAHGVEYARAHRLFRRAPLHHHLEEIGWPETRIVGRLWLITGLSTVLAVLWARTGWA